MKLAIMQPYFLPYLGYWQLLNIADRFLIYDDVNYINRGWVNRNRILINGRPSYITVPLCQASQNKRICDISLVHSPAWRKKLAKSIEINYRKAAFFSEVFPVIKKIIYCETIGLADYVAYSIVTLAGFMGINTDIIASSRCYKNNDLSGQDRIIDICKREGATAYINLPGGRALYDTSAFHDANISLCFMTMRFSTYEQRAGGFVPYLSVIDALMEIGVVGVMERMSDFDLDVK